MAAPDVTATKAAEELITNQQGAGDNSSNGIEGTKEQEALAADDTLLVSLKI